MEYEKTLNDVLKQLGMEIAFSPGQADLLDMVTREHELGLFISEVKHKSFVEVSEQGTEAAAATSVEIQVTSAPPSFFAMEVNRPFFFLIYDEVTEPMLFMGAVAEPQVKE